ncbi:MAG TPA: type 4a pilus biogenesis protein PilO [Candidatus Angelobacter sp.]|nr:type 4a pilus biogenesis protein PilO [Candidatus Angelobacter sp.]
MRNLAKIKRQFITIVAVLGGLDLVLMAFLFWPGSSPAAKLAQEDALRQQEKTLSREVAPLRNIEQTLTQTRVDVKKFYEQKVPAQFSQISQHLEKLVQETGVTTQGIRYSQDKNDPKVDLPDVQHINIDTTVTGDYAKVARFINALEQDKFVFVINQITLNGAEGGNLVSLQIKFETFLKET